MKIEFYLVDSFEIHHFAPIFNALKQQGVNVRIVAASNAVHVSGKWFDYDNAISVLKKLGLPYVSQPDPEADIAITTQHIEILRRYKKLKVRLGYSVGLNKDNFLYGKTASHGFDAVLVNGQHTKNHITHYIELNRIFVIGFPKHDRFFKTLCDRESLRLCYQIPLNKKVLLYLPTWSHNGSIPKFACCLQSVKDDYFIVTKLHHCTERLERFEDERKQVQQVSDWVAGNNEDFAQICAVADVILSDANSGALTEAAYLCPQTPIMAVKTDRQASTVYYDIFSSFQVVSDELSLKKALTCAQPIEQDVIADLYQCNQGQASKDCADALFEIQNLSKVSPGRSRRQAEWMVNFAKRCLDKIR